MMPARVVAKNAGRAPLMMWIAGESGDVYLSMFCCAPNTCSISQYSLDPGSRIAR